MKSRRNWYQAANLDFSKSRSKGSRRRHRRRDFQRWEA